MRLRPNGRAAERSWLRVGMTRRSLVVGVSAALRPDRVILPGLFSDITRASVFSPKPRTS